MLMLGPLTLRAASSFFIRFASLRETRPSTGHPCPVSSAITLRRVSLSPVKRSLASAP
jgi:hypothetical protein